MTVGEKQLFGGDLPICQTTAAFFKNSVQNGNMSVLSNVINYQIMKF